MAVSAGEEPTSAAISLCSCGSCALLLDVAIACTVTSDEPRHLAHAERANLALVGWERYHAAGIEVIDTATGAVVPQSIGQLPPLSHKQSTE